MGDIELFGTIFEKGEVIFRRGDPGDTMFVIQSGVVEISDNQEDRKVVLSLLEKGDFFGEMTLIDRRPRSADAVAITRARLLPISRDLFLDRTRVDTSIIHEIIRALCRRIERTNRLLRDKVNSEETSDTSPAILFEERFEALSKTQEARLPNANDRTGLSHSDTGAAFSVPAAIFDHATLHSVYYDKGETIFAEGDSGQEMYVIAEGEVDIFSEARGHRIPIARLGTKSFFGEMALATGSPRSATAVATRPTRLLAIDNRQLADQIEHQPELALFIIQILIARLRDVTTLLASPKPPSTRICRLLPPLVRKTAKAKMAVISLSSCGGCGAMLIESGRELAELSDLVDVIYCPMLMDAKSFDQVDVAVVDGVVRMTEDEDLLRQARRNSRILVAWGTCSVFGGLPAMANQHELEDLLEESFGRTTDPFDHYLSGASQRFCSIADSGAGKLLRKARKLDENVRVDYFLPGCPPKVSLLTDLVRELRGDKAANVSKGIVCAECQRKPDRNGIDTMWASPVADSMNGVCFISQGILCMGLMTQGGCQASCLKGGLPCWGCRGPTRKVSREISMGNYYEELMAAVLAKRTKLGEKDLRRVVRILRQRGGSSFCFENHYVKDALRLR